MSKVQGWRAVPRGRPHRVLRSLLAATALMGSFPLVLATPPAWAQAAPPAAARSFGIPRQPLAAALRRFADQSGMQLAYASADLQGLTSPGVRGSLPAVEALSRLLAGTGVTWRLTAANTVSIQRPVPAAGASAEGGLALDPIIVQGGGFFGATDGYVAEESRTGTKTGTPLIETPQSVSVVTRQQMDDQKAQSVSQALRYSAGVAPETRPGRYDYPNIRGFGSPGGADANFVGLMDGLRLPRGVYYISPSIDPYMLERVEILRGPSSILYGSVNPGGVVNLWSKRPTAEPLHEIDLEYGTFDRLQAGLDLGGPLTEDGSLLYRLTALGRDSGTPVAGTQDQRVSVAPAVTWTPNEDTSLTLLGSYQYDPAAGAFNYLPYEGTVKRASWGRFPTSFFDGDTGFDRSERTQYAVGYELEHKAGDVLTLRQNFRYMHADYDYRSVYQNGYDGPNSLTRATVATKESFDGIALDNQALLRFSTGEVEHTALFGIDYRHTGASALFGYGSAPSLDVLQPDHRQDIVMPAYASDTRQTLDQIGFYAQEQMKWGGLSLLLGARADWAETETDARALPGGASTLSHQADAAVTWRAGLVYEFDNGLAPYLSYSTSFEPVSGTDFHSQPFKASTAEQYEIGVKYQPDGFAGFFTVALFDITQTNVKTADPDPTHPYASIQTGEIRSRGVELEAHAEVTDNLSLLGSVTVLDIVNTESTDFKDKRPFGVPDRLASLWADYSFTDGTLDGLALGAGVRYVGSSWGNAENTLKVPDVTLFDLGLRYDLGMLQPELEGTQVSVNVSNLFDREFVASCWNETSCFYGTRRTITAGLKLRW
ncbi:TonB-dependent siderophore receptor [Inquilinus sp. NPDC058860]|uniref:TonB-dependent siderophore receptor n=1 Tax=Inquilinus sp. NPDC058860 TaxID=3346652 RepID=UPI0036B09A83